MMPRNSTRRRIVLCAAAVALSSLVLSGCSASATPKSDSIELKLVGGTGDMPRNFNPFIPGVQSAAQGLIFEPLFYYNLASGAEPEPMLGTAFEFNEDGTVLTISTREDVTWADGKPFTANDVAFTFNMIQTVPGLNTTGFEADIEVKDDNTVVFTYAHPAFVDAPSHLGSTAIVPEHLWVDIADPAKDQVPDPVGTGPYQLADFTPQSFVLDENDDYWGGDLAADRLRFVALSGNQSATDTFLAGGIDWMSSFIPELDTFFEGKDDFSWVNTPINQVAFYTCSNAELGCVGPQTDVAVRQAMYYALDREQLNKLAFSGYNAPISPTFALLGRDDQWIAPELEGAAEGDADRAVQLLTEAGYKKGSDGIFEKDGKRLSMTVQVVSGWSDYILAIDTATQQLASVGIEIVGQQVSWQEWTDAKSSGDFELSFDAVGQGAAAEPYYVYSNMFASRNTAPVGETANPNVSRYSNPVVDAAVSELALTTDEQTKKAQYAIIQKEIVRDMPYVPVLVNATLTQFSNAQVTGWPTEDDMYAFPASWKSWDSNIVVRGLKAVN